MAKAHMSGTVIAFRQSKFKQDSYQTIVDLADPKQAEKLLGARVEWKRADGLRILGRVVARHGLRGGDHAVGVGGAQLGLGDEVTVHEGLCSLA